MEVLNLSKSEEERAVTLHNKSIFINALDDSPLINGYVSYMTKIFMDKLKREGVTAIQETICDMEWGVHRTIKAMGEWNEMIKQAADRMLLAKTADDIRRAKHEGKVATIYGFQHAPIENDLNLLTTYHQLGLRVMQITYSERNQIGDGCFEKKDCGLSSFGEEVVEKMNELGILIDLSHVGDKTTLEAIEVSKDPCCYTHSNPRALMDKVRNKTDEQIKALAEKGGVMGLTFYTHLIREDQLPTIWGDYVDMIEYVVDLVGIDYVGTGLDVAYGVTVDHPIYKQMLEKYPSIYNVPGYTQMERLNWYMSEECSWMNVTRGLVKRGYSDQEIQKILGLNFLRLFEKTWRK
jgi:membrane dipeptidase